MTAWLGLSALMVLGMAPASGQTPSAVDPTAFASAADVRATVAAMTRAMTPDQHFAWRPLLRDGRTVAAIEIWTAPGRPAVHPSDGEYTIVLEGAGTLLSGGRLIDAGATRPDLIEGDRIEGGTRRAIRPGDAMLIPAGTPHWFGVDGGRLVLLDIKLPQGAR